MYDDEKPPPWWFKPVLLGAIASVIALAVAAIELTK